MRKNQLKEAKDIVSMIMTARAALQRLEIEEPGNDMRRFELNNLICLLKTESLDLLINVINNEENQVKEAA